MEVSGFAAALPELIEMIPLLLNVTQWLFYIFLVFLCGAIALKGLRIAMPSVAAMAARVLAGALCLFGGISFSGFVPYLNSGIMHFLYMDLVIASLAVSGVLYVAFRLLTYGSAALTAEEGADALKRKVQALEDKLAHGGGRITEKEARSLAEKEMHGYSASRATLAGSEWAVDLAKGDKKARVMIDAWDGEIKGVSGGFGGASILHPAKIAGVAVIAAVAILSIVFFEGVPDPVSGFTEIFGLSPEEIAQMSDALRGGPLSGDLPEGCASPMIFNRYQSSLADREFLLENLYEDNTTKESVEDRTGENVNIMLRFDDGGDDIIMAFTDEGKGCYFTDGIFCGCVG